MSHLFVFRYSLNPSFVFPAVPAGALPFFNSSKACESIQSSHLFSISRFQAKIHQRMRRIMSTEQILKKNREKATYPLSPPVRIGYDRSANLP
jgi:hypothetical protein